MPIQPEALERALERGLAPAYLVAGDETLLVEESCDAIIARARAAGFSERQIIQADSAFEWHRLAEAASSLSLFAERRIIDLRLPVKKLDKEAGEAIAEYLTRATGDTLLLVRTEQLDKRKRDAAWFSRLDQGGVVVLIWPVSADKLPGWLAARCRKAGIALARDALAFLADSIEGNLLAAAQEIEKLRLLDLEQPISLDALRAAVQDASYFDGFDLLDAALAGDGPRVRHIVYVLREQGVEPLAVLGLFGYGIRRLVNKVAGGAPPQRLRLEEAARRRLGESDLAAAVTLSQIVDRQVKGAALGDAWQTLECLALRLAGVRTPWLSRSVAPGAR